MKGQKTAGLYEIKRKNQGKEVRGAYQSKICAPEVAMKKCAR